MKIVKINSTMFHTCHDTDMFRNPITNSYSSVQYEDFN